jgi:hypothetical protein
VVSKDWLEIAQLVSSTAAAAGLFLTFWQMLRARRVADLQALQRFFDSANEREAALATASDATAQTYAFNELLSFVEVYASAHNRKLFGSGSEEIVRHKLEDCIIELEAAQEWRALIDAATDRTRTFVETRKFMRRYRHELDLSRAERALKRRASQDPENDAL